MNEAQRITEWVEQKKESAIALARAVWGFAEPNWRETQSAAAISARAGGRGLCAGAPPLRHGDGFRRTWGGEGPVIAFLGEYDALPRFPSRRAALKKRRFARARQAMAAGTTCWARAALPQPWR